MIFTSSPEPSSRTVLVMIQSVYMSYVKGRVGGPRLVGLRYIIHISVSRLSDVTNQIPHLFKPQSSKSLRVQSSDPEFVLDQILASEVR